MGCVMPFNTPDITLTLAGIEYEDIVEKMTIEGGCTSPLAICELTLANMHGDIEELPSDKDPLLLDAGLEDEPIRLFDGTVWKAFASLEQRIVLTALCRARQLGDTQVTTTYQNERADAIVGHLVDPFSFASRTINTAPAVIDKLPLCGHTVIEALRLLDRALDTHHAVYCRPDGSLFWGLFDATQAAAERFTIGEDIIGYRQLAPGRMLIDVFGTPIWHSTIIEVVDADGAVMRHAVEAFRHTLGISDQGFRSRLWLRQLGGA